MLAASARRNGLLLGLFALVATVVIAATQLGTRERIAANKRQSEERALLEIIPRSRHDNVMLEESFLINDREALGLSAPRPAYIARQDGDPVAVILPLVAPDGYSGAIHLLVGINADGTLAGIRVVAHRETPGLGDKIEPGKSDWAQQFIGKSLENPSADRWTVRKDDGAFDQFTGATITPRAVTHAVRRALEYFAAHRQQLLRPVTANQATTHD